MKKDRDVIAYVSDDIIFDRFNNLPYRELSKKETMEYMKKLKLSYYYEVDEEQKDKYLKYYGEMFPRWYEKYQEANEKNKQILLEKAIENSIKYRDEFIRNNMRLVIFIAKKYRKYDHLENLYQEGMVALIRSVMSFDFETGNKFSSFASVAIERQINKYIQDNSLLIRIPGKRFTDINKLTYLETEGQKYPGVETNDEEIKKKMNINDKQLYKLRKNREINKTIRLDEPMPEHEDSVLGDFVEDKKSRFIDKLLDSLMIEHIINMIENLDITPKEKTIIYMYYGFNGYDEPHSYNEIAKKLDLSATRIHQLEQRTLKKIRAELLKQKLKESKSYDESITSCSESFKRYDILSNRLSDSTFKYIRNCLFCSNLNLLSTKQKYIISRIYGLNTSCLPDSDIAVLLNITTEEVNKIEKETLNTLGIKPPVDYKKYRR